MPCRALALAAEQDSNQYAHEWALRHDIRSTLQRYPESQTLAAAFWLEALVARAVTHEQYLASDNSAMAAFHPCGEVNKTVAAASSLNAAR